MKKVTYAAAVALLSLTFGFASCESKTAENVETETEEAIEEIEAEADSISLDSIEVRDTPVEDGVADKVGE